MRDDTKTLAELRMRIDELDAGIHALLIERSAVIDELVAAKRTGTDGPAFRPGREASMLQALRKRHRGNFPFLSVVNIWRVIIATFTQMQAGFSVHVAGNDPALRDLARFQFGFATELKVAADRYSAIAAVGKKRGDLALIAMEDGDDWWSDAFSGDLKAIAVLPEIWESDSTTRAVVIADASIDTGDLALDIFALRAPDSGTLAESLATSGIDVLARSPSSALVAVERSSSQAFCKHAGELGISVSPAGGSTMMNAGATS